MNFEELNSDVEETARETSPHPGSSDARQEKAAGKRPITIDVEDEPVRQSKTKKGRTKHAARKRKRAEKSGSDSDDPEEFWTWAFLSLRKVDLVGPDFVERLETHDPDHHKRLAERTTELSDTVRRQSDELQKLTVLAKNAEEEKAFWKGEFDRVEGEKAGLQADRDQADAEVAKLRAENLQLMDKSTLLMNQEMELMDENRSLKEDLPGRALAWAKENKAAILQVLLDSPDEGVDTFRLAYKEPVGEKILTQLGSYGFRCGQKKERDVFHKILAEKAGDLDVTALGLPKPVKTVPLPPFNLE